MAIRFKNLHFVGSRFARVAFVLVLTTTFFAPFSLAQDSESEGKPDAKFPFAEIKSRLDSKKNLVKSILKGKPPLSGNEEAFDSFFLETELPKFTHAIYHDNLLEFREQFHKDFFYRATNVEAVDRLNGLILQFMTGVVRGTRRAETGKKSVTVYWRGAKLYKLDNKPVKVASVEKLSKSRRDFRPVVRFNAMLMIGELSRLKSSETQDRRSFNNRAGTISDPGVVYDPAFQLILNMASNEYFESGNKKFAKTEKIRIPGTVRIGAMLSLKRYVQADRSSEVQANVATKMLNVARGNNLSPADSEAGRVWQRRMAVEVLGAQAYAGNNYEVLKSLSDLLMDQSIPVPVRRAAADAVGRLQVAKSPPAKVALGVLASLARFARDVSEGELEHFDPIKFPNEKFSTAQVVSSVESIQFAINGPKPKPNLDKKKTSQETNPEEEAVKMGFAAWANPALKIRGDELVKVVKRMRNDAIQEANSKKKSPTAFAAKLRKSMRPLKSIINPAAETDSSDSEFK